MDTVIKELQKLKVTATYEKKKQYNASNRHRNYHNLLQVTVIVISAINGSALITLLKLGVVWFGYISAGISLLSAVLCGIQKFVKFDQVAEQNHDAGNQYLLLIKEIDMAVALYNDTGDQSRLEVACETLTKRYGEILAMAKNAPTNRKDYAKARGGIANGEENYSAADMSIGQQI